MSRESRFFPQADLLVSVLPCVDEEPTLALKGGTAINLFVRDLPRLSVDVDLTYVEVTPRDAALVSISDALKRIAKSVEAGTPRAKCQMIGKRESGRVERLLVRRDGAQIKIEPNFVIRGTVFPCERRRLTPAAEKLFARSADVTLVSIPDLYGGKICAALDRQHPRDLFDIAMMFRAEGLTEDIRRAFVVYLASHDRPMAELLDPPRKPIEEVHSREFEGMSLEPIPIEELVTSRERLITAIRTDMTQSEREFLLSVKRGEPRWDRLGIEGVARLPAVQWKVANISKLRLNAGKHAAALAKLTEILRM